MRLNMPGLGLRQSQSESAGVRAVENGIDPPADRDQALCIFSWMLVQRIHVEQAAPDARLVGRHTTGSRSG
jgi:hypothetical protein